MNRTQGSGPVYGQVRLGDIAGVLKLGWRDFRRAPAFGLFFSGVYVVGGIVLIALGAGHVSWVLATSLGFPLIAPFAAAGLYDVSRKLEAGRPLLWKEVLGGVWQERRRELPMLGALIVVYFLFWTFLAHMIFALFMGLTPMTNVMTDFGVFLTGNGLAMIAVELAVGGVLAFILFALTAASLPMVIDREVDFVTAMLRSGQAVMANLPVMIVWAAVIAVLTLLAMLPYFLGLFIVLPILGHATWHMYRLLIG